MLLGLENIYTDEKGAKIPVISTIIAVPTFWCYYILSEFLWQRTIGKLLTKTKVVTISGDKPTFLQILGRTLSRSIPFEYLSYFVSMSGIHDRLSGTRVIRE